jgi:hypothetical protein
LSKYDFYQNESRRLHGSSATCAMKFQNPIAFFMPVICWCLVPMGMIGVIVCGTGLLAEHAAIGASNAQNFEGAPMALYFLLLW